MAGARDPLFQRRRVRGELRRLRGEAHLTQREVAQALDWSPSKLIRIETGVVGISVTDLRALLAHYGVVDAAYVEDLTTAARESRQPPWWQQYRDILDAQYQALLGFESEASTIREFNPLLVPGLLETEAYIRALFTGLGSNLEVDDRLLQARLDRQALLDREPRPEMYFILDEAAIHRPVGGPEVMAAQLRRLKEFAQQPGITIQIVNIDVGAYVGLEGPLIIFEMPDGEDIVFLEAAGANRLIYDNPEQNYKYVARFQALQHEVARPPSETDAILDAAIKTMSS